MLYVNEMMYSRRIIMYSLMDLLVGKVFGIVDFDRIFLIFLNSLFKWPPIMGFHTNHLILGHVVIDDDVQCLDVLCLYLG